jgi:hypothetical protein
MIEHRCHTHHYCRSSPATPPLAPLRDSKARLCASVAQHAANHPSLTSSYIKFATNESLWSQRATRFQPSQYG